MISHVNFMITNKCNSNCRYCYLDAGKDNQIEDLELDLVLQFLERFKQSGGQSILFTGGEVLLYPGIERILRFASDLGLAVSLFTNGLDLNPAKFKEIRDYVTYFSTSLDGPAEIHDHNRGVTGAYQKTVQVLEMFKEHGINYSLQMTIGQANLEHIDYLGELASKYQANNVSLVKIIDQGRGKNCSDQLLASDLLQIKKKASQLSKKYKYRPYFVTHIYLENEIKTYFKSDLLLPVYWIDWLGDLCLYSVDHKKNFLLTNIRDYPEGMQAEVWEHEKNLTKRFAKRVRDAQIISFDEELERSLQEYSLLV